MKTGVIVGRFQADVLHAGYKILLKEVNRRCSNNTVIVIGKARAPFTDRNPIPPPFIAGLFRDEGNYRIRILEDEHSDEVWSNNLDKILDEFPNPTIYESRDGFSAHYKGKYKVETLDDLGLNYLNSTERRNIIGKGWISDNNSFRRGLIFASQNRFPVVYPVVDIVVVKYSIQYEHNVNYQVLLGKKRGYELMCFPGGFVDPGDKDFLTAASRELSEEVPGLNHHGLEYIGSCKIDDWRYRGTKDSIMSSVFFTHYMAGPLKAGDDLDSVQWVDVIESNRNMVQAAHYPIWDLMIKKLQPHL